MNSISFQSPLTLLNGRVPSQKRSCTFKVPCHLGLKYPILLHTIENEFEHWSVGVCSHLKSFQAFGGIN